MFGRRPDATLVRDLPTMRRFMPFVSPRRNDSLVYFAQEVDLEAACVFAESQSRTRSGDAPLTCFHLALRAIALTLEERPRLNRFVAGGRVWQRDGFWITFSAKQHMDDDAPLLTVKRRFEPGESLDGMLHAIHQALHTGRSGRKSASDREMAWLLRLPPPLVRLAVGFARGVDALGALPRSMIEADPLFSSVFVANLGSVGLDAGYHHLWEYGNCPVFCVIGRIQRGADGRRRAAFKWTYDERIEDGLYCARALEYFRERLEHPEKL